MSTETTKKTISEDWIVVLLGFLIIVAFLSGTIVPAPVFGWKDQDQLFSTVLSASNVVKIGLQFLTILFLGLLGFFFMGKSVKGFLLWIPFVYLITIVALIVAGNEFVKGLGLEAVIFSLIFGLTIGNFFTLPQGLKDSLTSELFVKIGLVLLGTSVIFSDILKAGFLGLVQALVVVLSVWYFAYWLCKKLKIDEELTMMISSAVSICGVSAAIATSGAIKGDSKKLSYVISLVLVTAIPMMIMMPYAAKFFGLSQEVTGAWLGGTIDTTGAVVASGSLVGETALKISTIVKFSQNVLLGIAAFAISIYWSYRNVDTEAVRDSKPTLKIIWERFPKFVLGFMAASLIFSFFLAPQAIEPMKGSLKSLQTLWFVLAFTSIGLETNFSDLFKTESRKPLYAFLIAQGFNIVITLVIALLLFR